MIRAGERGQLIENFAKGYVAIGWNAVGDLSEVKSIDEVRQRYSKAYPNDSKAVAAIGAATLFKFRNSVKVGDSVVTYDPSEREYSVGKITGEYVFDTNLIPNYAHSHKVNWERQVSRDALKAASKNSLGSLVTLFVVNDDVLADLLNAGRAAPEIVNQEIQVAEKEAIQQLKTDIEGKAHELIKDKLLKLSDRDMEELVAAVLRAMGFKARVSPLGPDRGVDVFASPDGLGFQEPRIKAEVKHRPGEKIGAQQIRSFLGALRPGDKGLFVSTGGFAKDARYEADRANNPITLLGLDELAELVVEHYANFDSEGQALLPLVRIYWPNE